MSETSSNSLPPESLQRLRDESTDLLFNERAMHEGLVEFESDLIYDPDLDLPTIEIVDDREIAVNGVHILLNQSKTFVLNALRLAQGFPRARAEMHDLGFWGTPQILTRSLNELRSALDVASPEQTIILREGERNLVTYTLLPEVMILDRRQERSYMSDKAQLLHHCVDFDATNQATDDVVVFNMPNTQKNRQLVTQAMIRDFKDEFDADDRVVKYIQEKFSLDQRTLENPIALVRRMARLTKPERALFLKDKEDAIMTYISRIDNGSFTPEERQQIARGVHATYQLFFHSIGQLVNAAAENSGWWQSFEELYQEAAVEVFKTILQMSYDPTGYHNFMFIIDKRLERLMNKLRTASISSLSYAHQNARELYWINTAVKEMHNETGIFPSSAEIAERLAMEPGRVAMLRGIGRQVVSVYSPIFDDSDFTIDSMLSAEEDPVGRELEEVDKQDALDILFTSDALTDTEKIALSLENRYFHPSLRGAELTVQGKLVFTYPYDDETFNGIAGRRFTLSDFCRTTLGVSNNYLYRPYNNALRKARSLLQGTPVAEIYNGKDIFEEEEARRAEIISMALELSPDRRLGTREINELSRQGLISSDNEISYLFGSIPEFQQACGFKPDIMIMSRNMTNEQIIELALELQPESPLTTPQIRALSKAEKFVSFELIHRRFGSVPEFQEACGFEVSSKGRRMADGMTKEDIIKLALELQPDKPMSAKDIAAYSVDGRFVSASTVAKHFGSHPEFQRACGFEPIRPGPKPKNKEG